MNMDRRRHRTDDLRADSYSGIEGRIWLYDPEREEFFGCPGIPEAQFPRDRFQGRRPFPPGLLRTRGGRVLHWLFAKGGISVVFLLGLMTVGLLGLVIGSR
jgi:hypothetical protein